MKSLFILLLLTATLASFFFLREEGKSVAQEWPVTEAKPFVIVLYAHNQAPWCKKALQSLFRQTYDQYRIIAIDDGSVDGTYDAAQQVTVEGHQEERVLLLRN